MIGFSFPELSFLFPIWMFPDHCLWSTLQIIDYKLFRRWNCVVFILNNTLHIYFSSYESQADSICIPPKTWFAGFLFAYLDILISFHMLDAYGYYTPPAFSKILLIPSKSHNFYGSLVREQLIFQEGF